MPAPAKAVGRGERLPAAEVAALHRRGTAVGLGWAGGRRLARPRGVTARACERLYSLSLGVQCVLKRGPGFFSRRHALYFRLQPAPLALPTLPTVGSASAGSLTNVCGFWVRASLNQACTWAGGRMNTQGRRWQPTSRARCGWLAGPCAGRAAQPSGALAEPLASAPARTGAQPWGKHGLMVQEHHSQHLPGRAIPPGSA